MKRFNVPNPIARFVCTVVIIAGVLGLSNLFAAANEPETIDRIVAEVNDDIITLYELNQAARPFVERVRNMGRPLDEERRMLFDVREKILNQMIDQKLTDQEIERLKISVSEETVDRTIEEVKKENYMSDAELQAQLKREGMSMEEYRNQVRDQILRGRLVNREVKSKIVVTEEDIQACYIENKEKYCGEKRYHIRHIILMVQPGADAGQKEAVHQRMEAVLAALDSGEPFDQIARTYSESPLRDEGGDLGAFELKDLSRPIRSAVEKLEPGAYSPVVDTEQGLQIFYLEQISETPEKTVDEARAEIEKQLYNEVVNQKFKEWLTDLRQKSHVKIIR